MKIQIRVATFTNDVLVVEFDVADCAVRELHCRVGVGSTSRCHSGNRWMATLFRKLKKKKKLSSQDSFR